MSAPNNVDRAARLQKATRRPTMRQRLVVGHLVENGGSLGKAMRAAGYSNAMANNPAKLTRSKGFMELLEEAGVTDERIAKVMNEGLEATKPVYRNNPISGEVEILVETPDFGVRHKFLETAMKVKGHVAPETPPPAGPTYNTQINIGDKTPRGAQLVESFTQFMLEQTATKKVIDVEG
jgi:hypothetical protein